jgi:hypothetical protein
MPCRAARSENSTAISSETCFHAAA